MSLKYSDFQEDTFEAGRKCGRAQLAKELGLAIQPTLSGETPPPTAEGIGVALARVIAAMTIVSEQCMNEIQAYKREFPAGP